MIIYDNALGQFVLLNKHKLRLSLPNHLRYAQFELAMVDKMSATMGRMAFWGHVFIEFSTSVQSYYFEIIDKTSIPEMQSATDGHRHSFRLWILLMQKHYGFCEEITHIDPVAITYFKLSSFLFRNIYIGG